MSRKTILITGASRGIGKACALRFACGGYHVFLNCHKSIEQLKDLEKEIQMIPGASCDLVVGNVGDPEDVRQMFRIIESSCRGIDVLINNAGIAYMGLLSDMTDEEWMNIIQTNLSSAFYTSRAAIPYMVSEKRGRIINISSMWGTVGASCEAAYSAAKSGIHGLTRALAKELAPSNIQVNALACGVIDTTMNHLLTEEEKTALADEIPMCRFGTPEEIAEVVWQTAHAPEYMTGQIIGVDGGYI